MVGVARLALLAAAVLLLQACGIVADAAGGPSVAMGDPARPPMFHATDNPERLSEWNVLQITEGELRLGRAVVAYDLNTPLFTDYAHKLRTVWMPEGTSARFDPEESFDFPVGTIISKTFYYPREGGEGKVERSADDTETRLAAGFDLARVRLVETRLLIRREGGWTALPYVWNEAQTEAVLKRTGAIAPLTLVADDGSETGFNYVVPNANQCQGCHATNATTRTIHPIGPKARHLNKSFAYRGGTRNQLEEWADRGLLRDLPQDRAGIAHNAVWTDASLPLAARARSYLDINCSHCHNARGAADTSGLVLDPATPLGPHTGLCKLPIAAGTGTGNRRFGIVPGEPDQSILVYRMQSTDPSVMMPEVGRSLRHEEGVSLIARWVASLEGSCL